MHVHVMAPKHVANPPPINLDQKIGCRTPNTKLTFSGISPVTYEV